MKIKTKDNMYKHMVLCKKLALLNTTLNIAAFIWYLCTKDITAIIIQGILLGLLIVVLLAAIRTRYLLGKWDHNA